MRLKTGKVKKGAEAPFTHRGYPFTTSLTNNLLNTYFSLLRTNGYRPIRILS